MKEQMPDNWATFPLGELIEFSLGGDWGKPPEFEDPDYLLVRCLRSSEVKNWACDKGASAAPRKIKNSSLEKRRLIPGDIIVEVSGGGPEQPVGRTLLIDDSVLSRNPEVPKICTNFFRLIRPTAIVDPPFLNWFLQFFYKSGQISDLQGGSNNLRNLKFRDYLLIYVPVPPLNEQLRIVAKIEELFSELDDSVANLQAARVRLQTYRQSVLKHAFEGRLTKQWRRDHANELENADQLLERIREERQARYQQQLGGWEAEVAHWESNGKLGKKPRRPKAPKALPEPSEAELEDLPELPDGWGWVRLGEAAEIAGGLTKNPKRQSLNITRPFLRVGNVYANHLNLEEIHEIGIEESELPKVTLEQGDLLIVEGNGSVDQIGRVAVWDAQIPGAVHQNHLIRARPAGVIHPFFALWFLLSKQGRNHIMRVASSTSGLHTLSLSKVENLLVPVCSPREQRLVVDELEAKLSHMNEAIQTIESSIRQTEALRQSILLRAFEGCLVPQNPDDEPVGELLARIRGEAVTGGKTAVGVGEVPKETEA